MKRRTKVGDIVRLNRSYSLDTMVKVLFTMKDVEPGHPHLDLVKNMASVTGKVTKAGSEYKGKYKWWRSVAFEKYGQLWVPPKFLVHAPPIISGTWVRISPRYRPKQVAEEMCYASLNLADAQSRNRMNDATGLTMFVGRVSTTYSNGEWARVNFQTKCGEVWIPTRLLIAAEDQPPELKSRVLEFEEV